MSDGALSQDEIDSLLAGLDSGGGAPTPAKVASNQAASPEARAFKEILDSMAGAQSQNLSMMTGLTVEVSPPTVDLTTRDPFLQSLPEEVLAVRIDMTASLPGEHLFIMGKETALRIASLANKDEGLSELDDMATSAVQECVSTMTGTEITTFCDRTGNRGIQSSTADGSFGPKAMVRPPMGDFLRAVYRVQIGEEAHSLVEIFAMPFVRDVVAASGGGRQTEAPRQQSQAQMGGQQAMMAQQMNGMQGMMPQQMMQPMMQQGYGGMQMGYAPQGAMMGMSPPNVQPVQFANLGNQRASAESGNIGLIMDVYMELTVELGRTKKLIKEILGMGEGTIIELDKLAGEPVDILVNHKLIAKGEVVVIDENFGVRVTEIVSPMERMADLG